MHPRKILPSALLAALIGIGLSKSAPAEPLRIPAFTAYFVPEPNRARISEQHGITRWTNPDLKVTWLGELRNTGSLNAKLSLRLKAGSSSKLKLTVAGQSRERSVKGNGDTATSIDFGEFNIAKAGYHSLVLESLNPATEPAGDLDALFLDGPALKDAHFNLKPRRNAASVHLSYSVEKGTEVSAFYCEVTGIDEPLWTFYMACGWHRGYFGMQINSPTERRIIFSVWDSGGEAIDRDKVTSENRVQLVAKGEGVYSGDFGNEGTGGHSHLKFPWKTGETQRFLATAEPVSETHTVFAGYWFRPDKQEWMLISSWKAPKEGKYMRGLHSFSENFVGRNGHVRRKARYGNQWLRTSAGEWREITTAKFSHDATGKSDRLDRFMGVEDGQFFLSHGGFVPGFTKFGTPFDRPPSGRSPAKMKLPPLPKAKKELVPTGER